MSCPNDRPPSDRTQLRRNAKRACYDRATIHAILDEAWICHVAFHRDGYPTVLPTAHWRIDDTLYLHGAAGSRTLKALSERIESCVAVTLFDGLVLARSAFHHSMNYRSVVVYGIATPVYDAAEKRRILNAFIDKISPQRRDEIRGPSAKELSATAVLALPLTEVSAKVRTGPPVDDVDDYALPVWAGVLPLQRQWQAPIAAPDLVPGVVPPRYLVTPWRA